MTRLSMALLVSLLLASCASYPKDFRAAAKEHQPSPLPSGPWKGTWKSDVNGHSGPLWCLISQDPSQPDLWNFRYRAGWGVLQFGDYTHQIKARTTMAGEFRLPVRGEMTLPNNFGTYSVEGAVFHDRLKLRYKGRGDRGTMALTRPPKR